MVKANRWLCVVDIKNEQEDYAKASLLLTELARIENGEAVNTSELPIVFQIARSSSNPLNAVALESLENTIKEASPGKISKITS